MKRIEGWEDYSITENGQVFSHRNNKWLKLQVKAKNYFGIQLNKNGIAKEFLVHRLVAQAFIPNPEGKPEVNHIDGNKQNNNISNLEWVTSSENQKHSFANNLQKIIKGKEHWNSKLTEENVKYIRENYKFRDKEFSFAAMGRKFGVNITTVVHAYYGKDWSHI